MRTFLLAAALLLSSIALANPSDSLRIAQDRSASVALRVRAVVDAARACDAKPVLTRLLSDPEAEVRAAAITGLGLTLSRVSPKANVEELAAWLDDPAPGVRKAAALALSGAGEAARPGLIERLAVESDEDVRRALQAALHIVLN